MKLNYDCERPDYDKCDCREPKKHGYYEYDKCDYHEPKKHGYYEYDRCDCHEPKKHDYYDDKCCDDHKFAKCCPKSPCPYPILFECAQGTGTEITRTIPDGLGTGSVNYFSPRSLGCLTIDTTCLKMPVVKFDFCSIIKFFSQGNENRPVRLTFQLFKQCDNGPEVACGTWNYVNALDTVREQLTTAFNFCYCECNSCPGCCTYTVKITEAVNVILDDQLTVFSPTLSAIAKSGC